MKEPFWTGFATVLMTFWWCFVIGLAFLDRLFLDSATVYNGYFIGLLFGGVGVFFTWLCLMKWIEK